MNLKNYIHLICTILVLIGSISAGQSQGIVYINADVYIGQSQTFAPAGASAMSATSLPKKGTLTLSGGTVTYNPPSFSCLDTFTVRYQLISGGIKYFNYASYAVRVDYAFLDLKDDYAFTSKNQDVTIDVLANDVAKHKQGTGNVYLNSVSLVNNGTASILNDQIKFVPTIGFTGLAYINYVACDDVYGNCKSATATIAVNEATLSNTTASIATAKNTPIAVIVPNSTYALSGAASNGTVALIENNAYKYTPATNFVGNDVLVFTSTAGNTHTVSIEVINKANQNRFAVNDLVYTPKNTAVQFNVLSNDRAISPMVANFSQPKANYGSVSAVNGGTLQFTPTNGFSGVATFQYNLINGGGVPTSNNINEIADVNVVVSDFYPGKQVFELKTPVNTALVLNYNIPILGWNWTIADQPLHGNVAYFSGNTSMTIGGNLVSGANLLVYTPSNNYVGQDQFEVIYNINGNYRTVKCYVNIEAVTPTLPNYCVGDCVWAGDANNDGIVDITDLLPIGYCQGELGIGRPNASAGWYGQFANNWVQPLMPGINMKYIDTDGDGEVNATDVQLIDTHYGKTHNITPEKVINYKQIPMSFQVLTPNPQIGDLVEVDVLLGASGNPAKDMYGFTMNFLTDPNVVNYASLGMDFYPNSWMTYNAPTLSLAKKHTGQQIDFGMVRTGGKAATGIGKVAKMHFIIDDDLNGIRDEDGIYTATIAMQGGTVMGSDGIAYQLEPQDIPIKINTKRKQAAFDATKVVTYPNPTSNSLNIYINGGYEITAYSVYNLAGQQVLQNTSSGKTTSVDVATLQNGIYFVKVITDGGVVTKKFEVIK